MHAHPIIHRVHADEIYRCRHFDRSSTRDITTIRIEHGATMTRPIVGIDRPFRVGMFFPVVKSLAPPVHTIPMSPARSALLWHRTYRMLIHANAAS